MRRFLLVFLAFGVLSLIPTSTSEAASFLDEGRNAEAAENYQRAIELYRQAMEAAPDDPEPAQALAELFTEKGLHDLALPVWKQVVARAPGDWASWLALAQTWSYLDDNAQSVRTLDGARERFPQSAEITQSLAWMLFKTEDFQRGIALVEAYIREHGSDRSLEMTLGTLYSSLFNYDLSRIHYLKSITMAPGGGSEERNFRSIAWYNLSLLEKSFYQFDLADQAIRQSIDEEDRPAGSLAWGELHQSRRNFAEARRLYEKAVQADETPLGRFDLARLFQQFGLLEEAEGQLIQVERHNDDTWIYNYGVTKDKIRRDLHELRADLHRSRFYKLDFQARRTPWDWVLWWGNKVSEGFSWWYHDQTWKSLLVKLSNSSMAVRNSPDAWVGLTLAHRDRPALALKYLELVRRHELPKNPRSQASYLVEEGIISRDPQTLQRALSLIQVPWENEDAERAWAALAQRRGSEGNRAELNRILSRLYTLNPGGLAIRGWGLPVRVGIFGDSDLDAWKVAWRDYAAQTGWDAEGQDRQGVEWTLDWRAGSDGATWTLRNAEGTTVRSGVVRTGSRSFLECLQEVFLLIHSP